MRRGWCWFWSLLLLGATLWAQEPQVETLIIVEVVDESGKPIPNASVRVYALGEGDQFGSEVAEPRWRVTDAQGKATFTSVRLPFEDDPDWMFKSYPRWELRAVAAGYLPLKQVIERPQRGMTVRATLKRGGRPFLLTLQNETGKPLPKSLGIGVCAVNEDHLFTEYEVAPATRWVIPKQIYSQFSVEPLGEGRYRILLPESYAAPLMLMIHHPGFLRGFQATLDADAVQRGEAKVTLPKTHALTIRYDVSRVDPKQFKDLQVSLTGISLGGITDDGIPISTTLHATLVSGQGEVRFDDLPPGDYVAEISGLPVSGQGVLLNLRERFALREGQAHTVNLTYTPPDPAQYRGDRQHTVRILGVDGKPVARKPFRLTTQTDADETVVVLTGETDAEGRAHLKQLKPDVFYRLEVDGRPTSVAFVVGDKDFAPPAEGYLEPQPGDPAPDIVLQPMQGEKTLRLSELQGKWVYLDFWATWCGPCRTALEKLAMELPELKELHKNRVVVLTVSIDDTPQLVEPYLKQLGLWAHGGHYWAGAGGWRSPAAQRFVVFGIPHAVLIDPKGVIVWRGYPVEPVAALLSEHMQRVK